MDRVQKIILGVFLALIVLLTYVKAQQSQPLNWNPSYSATHKIPLGTYVLFQNLKDQDFQLEKIKTPPYLFLNDTTASGTYVFINDKLIFDDTELDKLLAWTSRGNTLFLASDAFGKNLLDTLNLNIKTAVPQQGFSSKPMFNLVQPQFKSNKPYLFDHEGYHSVFMEIDTLKHTVLGVSQLYTNTLKITNPEVNFLKMNFGKGEIFMHTAPKAFSNYFILKNNNYEYVEKALAYVPAPGNLYWDGHYKTGKSFHTSPLYILLNQKELKWAYYFLIIGCLLFVIFEGKRKQRSIPIKHPLKNQTVDYTKTIAGLYLDKKEYREIAEKKIALFMNDIRVKFRVPISPINDTFYQKMASLSENSVTEVKSLFKLFNTLENKKTITRAELQELNKAIINFKNKNNGK